ncbi:nucleotidyltransferase family protein [Candidatus Poribacteria bacterium]|nr:nucleotidyltransferase family protein [Candidatus Poribacteria bacterium]MYF56854.1 nucleotidyltransferase family protein [Candidatus Poribacteria bacterium]MYI94740.1 nucleotidyltransferase family protein [Candidatus Poribacteria bacterium]
MRNQPTPSITGILLAAGLSVRMGQPKQLLPFGESTIIETVVDNMLNAKFNEIIVIVGHCAEQIHDKLKGRDVRIVFNPDYKDGMLTSVQRGVRSLGLENRQRLSADAILKDRCAFSLMLVDQPFITSDLISKVIDAYSGTDKGIVLPSYNNRRGHPVIFHNRYADDILALDADSGGVRSLFNVYSDDMHYVSVDTDAVLRDIDSPEDYRDAISEVDFNELDR